LLGATDGTSSQPGPVAPVPVDEVLVLVLVVVLDVVEELELVVLVAGPVGVAAVSSSPQPAQTRQHSDDPIRAYFSA